MYATDGGAEMTLDVRRHFALNVRYQFLLLYTVGDDGARGRGRGHRPSRSPTARCRRRGRGLPLTRFPLERTAEAHDAVEAGTVGKVLIDV